MNYSAYFTKPVSAIIAALLLTSISGCGYQFQGSGSTLPDDVKTLAVLSVENRTTQPNVGQKLEIALRERFDRYGAVKVIENEDLADALLTATIEKIEDNVLSVTGNTDIELQTDTVLVISGELQTRDGRVLWRNPRMAVSSSFANVSSTVSTSTSAFAESGLNAGAINTLGSREVSRGQKELALDDMIEEVARKVYLEAVAPDF